MLLLQQHHYTMVQKWLKHCHIIVFHLMFISLLIHSVIGGQVAMKIVQEPSNYGLNSGWNQQQSDTSSTSQLKLRVMPANFSGPAHFKRYDGKCFSKIDDSYRYDFCPFHNVSQHEQTFRWNPYQGVLGVWQEWEIENYTFTAMMYREGDRCGDISRSTKVIFKCGNKSEILNVTEPHTCHYEMLFRTPLVCHPHAMLVYPTLTSDLQTAWDEIEGELARYEITVQGYNKRVHRLLESAHYYLSPEVESDLKQRATAAEEKRKETAGFSTLPECQQEYVKLQTEILSLREQISLLEDRIRTHNENGLDGNHYDMDFAGDYI